MQNYPRVFRNALADLNVTQITKFNDFLKSYPIFLVYSIMMDKTRCIQVIDDAVSTGVITVTIADIMKARLNQDTPQP